MFNEWYKPNSKLEFPRGGSQAMVDALARGASKRGARLHTKSHVDEILMEGGKARGVHLQGGAQASLDLMSKVPDLRAVCHAYESVIAFAQA